MDGKEKNSKQQYVLWRCTGCGKTFLEPAEGEVRCPCCSSSFVIPWTGEKSTFKVEGTDASEVQAVTLAIMEKASMKTLGKRPNPWASGSFYLIVFIVAIAALSVVGHLIPIITFPIVLIGGILALSVIGAFQLRQDERLSEENFLKLMVLSLKYLPWLTRKQEPEPDRQSALKNYLYVSDVKLDMLCSQIPKNLLNEIAAELRIDVKLWVVDIGTTIKPNQSEETRYSKLRVLIQYMEKQLYAVGTIDAPQAYFKGTLEMNWGREEVRDQTHGGTTDIVLFIGSTDQTALYLTGSAQHVIGSVESQKAAQGSFSLVNFVYAIGNILVMDEVLRPEYYTPLDRFEDNIVNALRDFSVLQSQGKYSRFPKQRLEFLAKKLLRDPDEVATEKRPFVLVGTPIYVALAD